jgi:hypothetical protein
LLDGKRFLPQTGPEPVKIAVKVETAKMVGTHDE